MTIYTKPSVRNAWGQTASGADLVDPGNTFASAGWQIGVKPPRQYFNWVLNYVFAGIRYFSQSGIPAWDAAETYGPYGYVISPNGYMCRSTGNTTNQNPESNFGPSSAWDSPNVLTPPYPDSTSRVVNTAWVSSHFIPVGSSFSAISGQVQSGQVPVGAVTQWQGSLSIGGGQVTSAVARSNTVNLVNGNAYLTFFWNGQPGQPTWLFGSNDGANAYVWNPANFSVANATTVAGLSVSTSASGNTVMARDANGYATAQYFWQASANSENPSISQIMVTNGADNFIRKASRGALFNALVADGLLTAASFAGSTASNGYVKLPDGIIFQWLTCSPNGGTVFASFPIIFPNACRCVVATSTNAPTQCNVTSFTTGGASVFNTGGNSYVIAVGF